MVELRKHVNNTDVAFEVLNKFFVKEKGILKLKIAWWNIGRSHDPWPMKIEQKLSLSLEEWRQWKIYKGD